MLAMDKNLTRMTGLLLSLIAGAIFSTPTWAQQKPNILVIWGALFTDFYAEQSCTADRSGFITGQIPFRTGLTKVGLPGGKLGLSHEDPTIAELLKNHGSTWTAISEPSVVIVEM